MLVEPLQISDQHKKQIAVDSDYASVKSSIATEANNVIPQLNPSALLQEQKQRLIFGD